MALDLWFREDVERILTALASAKRDDPAYLQALHDVALAFGLVRPQQGSGTQLMIPERKQRF